MRGDKSGPEWVSPEGLRVDGRRPSELRRMKVSLGVLCGSSSSSSAAADGSARVDAGNTKVVAAVFGPRVPPGRPSGTAASAAAEIRVELSIAEFATAAAGKKRGVGGVASAEQRAVGSGASRDRRAAEAASALRDALEATVLASLHPRSRLDVCVSVLAADGAWLAAAANAAAAALAHAGVPCADLLCASTATLLSGCEEPLVDPTHSEECGDGVLVTVGLHSGAATRAASSSAAEGEGARPAPGTSDGQVAMFVSERRCPLDALERTAEAAARGARAAAAVVRTALLDASAVAVAARGGGCGVFLPSLLF